MGLEKCNAVFRETAAALGRAWLPVAAVLLPALPSWADQLPNGDYVAFARRTITVTSGATNLATKDNTSVYSHDGYYGATTSYELSNLYDGDAKTDIGVLNSNGTSDETYAPYIQVDFGAENNVGNVVVKLTPVDVSSSSSWIWNNSEDVKSYNFFPKTFTVSGSADGSSWTELGSFSTTYLVDGTEREGLSTGDYFTDPTSPIDMSSYRYMRITVTDAWGSWGAGMFDLGEFAVYDASNVSVTSNKLAIKKQGQDEWMTYTKLFKENKDNVKWSVSTNATQEEDYESGNEYAKDEGVDKLYDDDISTFFHSTWLTGKTSSTSYADAPEEPHYLQVDFGAEKDHFAIYMRPREDDSKVNLMPMIYTVYAYSGTGDTAPAITKNDEWKSSTEWTKLVTMSDTRGQEYFSGTMWTTDKVRYIRIVCESTYPENQYVQYTAEWDGGTWHQEIGTDNTTKDSKKRQVFFCLSELEICEPENTTLVESGSNFYEVYTASDGTTKTATFTQKLPVASSMTKAVVPDNISVDGSSINVTSISNTAFVGNEQLTSVTIGANVSSIGSNSFMNTPALKSIVVSGEKHSNGTYESSQVGDGDDSNALLATQSALYNGKTLLVYPEAIEEKNFTLPSDIIAIDQLAFYEAQYLKTIDLSQGGTSTGLTIADNAFQKAKALTTIKIPQHVTSVGAGAFEECPMLDSAYIYSPSIGAYCFRNDAALTTLDFYYDNEDDGETDIYKTRHGNTTTIGDKAFYGCTGLTGTLLLPRSITSLGSSAFEGCTGIETVEDWGRETSIPQGCFSGMTKLKTVYLYSPNLQDGAYVNAIASNAFDKTALSDLYVYSTQAFSGAALAGVGTAATNKLHVFADLVDDFQADAKGFVSKTSKTGFVNASSQIVPLTMDMTVGHGTTNDYSEASPYSTGVFEWNVKLPEGVTAYTATDKVTKKGTGEDGTDADKYYLTIQELGLGDDGTVPASTPVILMASQPGTAYSMELNSVSSTLAPEGNLLKGDAVEHFTTTGNDGDFYGMTYNTAGAAVFRKVKSDVVIPAGKVYMAAADMTKESEASAAKMLIIGSDEATGIRAIASDEADTTKPAIIYDLQGRRVASPAHGLYIINGKKIYVK